MRFETHTHTHYSNIRLIDSTITPKELIRESAKLGLLGVTITDHEALSGHVDFLNAEKELKEKGEIPKDFVCALGNEIYLTETREKSQKYYHYILIAKNTTGHKALRELSSQSWMNSYVYKRMERVPTLKSELVDIVKKYPDSLIATNACLGGELGTLVLQLIEMESKNNQEQILIIKKKIDDFIKFSLTLFGEDFYIEIAPGTSSEQRKFNKRIKSIANFYKLKMIVATDAHYLRPEKRVLHKAFLNSKDEEREVDDFYFDAHLMTDDEIYERIKENYTPEELSDMCHNSIEIMNKISNYELFHNPIIPKVEVKDCIKFFDSSLNDYPVLQELRNSSNLQECKWASECLKGLKDKGIEDKTHLERLELEADIIKHIGEKLGECLFAYFVTFQHYIDLFWDCGAVVGPGRGSAGSFLSNYLLGITQLDPVKWNLPYFRFLNKDRAELPDIDIDLPPSKRPLILRKIREERGSLNVIQVATFGTEKPKAAIGCACRGYRTEAYPNGIDVDESQHMASLVPVERGESWSLKDCLYGNEEKDRKPIQNLINEVSKYPGLEDILFEIEGLICRRGQHASGVILYNNSPFETTALMKSPNGDLTTQFDLHQSEQLGDTKFDFLVTDICDKLSVCLDLLVENGYFTECNTKREIYNKYLHPQVIDLKNENLWKNLANGSVQDVFQFNTDIGIQTAKAVKPKSPIEMTAANALLRLAAPEGQERPLTRYLRFKQDISLWYKEMEEFGLTKEEQKILEPYYLRDYGVPASQEQLMLMVMDPNISDFTLGEANNTRKVLAKKQLSKIPEVKEKFLNQCKSKKLGEYCWMTMMLPQMSYSFSEVHALLYTFIGIQTLVEATVFPPVFWNTACLIVNSQSIDEQDGEDEVRETVATYGDESEVDDSVEEDEDDELGEEPKKKKKQRAIPYGKIAKAIGKIRENGINVVPPDINKSSYTFSPDVEHNSIRYGLSGITKVGEDIVKNIIESRPYASLNDFLNKVKANKPQIINLIKSGAFDCFGDRRTVMREFVIISSDTKKRITLQNMKMLIDYELIPEEYNLQCRVYNFNKYLKKLKIDNLYYGLDQIAFDFFSANFNIDALQPCELTESGFKISQDKWKAIYEKQMDKVRPFIKKNSAELLLKVNEKIIDEFWKKYCLGSISKWEMDSISFYSHEHELSGVDFERYGIVNFSSLPEKPIVERVFPIDGKKIPLYEIKRICGTVLDRDKTKKTVTLLTTDGVVLVKIFGQVFANYDKQISEKGADGKKHILEKSTFSRGNKIVVTGVRDGDVFRAKKYKNTKFHLVEIIEKINEDGTMYIRPRTEVQ